MECFAAAQLLAWLRVSVAGLSPSDALYMRHSLPLFQPTRLETRTKESNLYASSRVFSKLECEMNVKVLFEN